MAKQKEAWDKLSMQEKAQLIKLSIDNGVSSLKQIRDTYNLYSSGGKKQSTVNRPRDIDEAIEISRNTPYNKNIDDVEGPGYREYMWKLAQAKSKVWGISPEEAYESFIHPSEFNYRRWYNLASQDELDNTLTNGDAHWMDVFGKTVGADTFSNESPYSGYVNPYNPKGITGGTWTGRLGIDEYIPSESQIDNNWPLNKAWFAIDRGNKYYQEKISKGEDTHEVPSIMTYNNGVMLPEITVTHRGNYIEYSPYANGGNLTHRKDYGGPTDYPEVTIKEEPWVDEYFKNNTNVAGMAIGEGMNGVNGDRRVIINPYNAQMSDSTSRASVLLNERLRHVMDQENFSLPNITKEQIQKYNGTSYQGDTLNIGRTEAARYLSGDPSHNLTGSQKQYIDSLKLNYKKSTGGPLYPFSFEKNPFLKTPVVRYDDGGFFARLFGKKDASPTPEEIKEDRVERFINDTWETEYSVPRGYDPTTGLFYPYKSPEGGTKTIGPGFKLRADGSGDATMFSAKEAAKGVTREQINEKLRAQGELQYDKVLEFLNQKGNRLPIDTINPNIMNGLMDLRFQVGALGGWDNLREAVLDGDLESIKKESLVTFKDGDTGKIKPDVRRNELRAKKFWHYD